MVGQKKTNSKTWVVLGGAIALPVVAVLWGSYLLASAVCRNQDTQNHQIKMEEVRAQSRLLLDQIWQEIDSVKVRTVAFSKNRVDLDPVLKTFSVITLGPGNTAGGIKEFQVSSGWNGAPEDIQARVRAAVKQVSFNELRETGVSIVRVPVQPGLVYLGIAFASPDFFFVTVDPTEVFTGFTRWVSRREAGGLRGYLIGADGKVLVHSERVFSGADFSGSEIFQQALRSLFQGQRIGGVATVHSVDLRTALTAYLRVTGLPLAVVVERVIRPVAQSGGATLMRQVLIPAFFLLAVVLVICLFSILAVQKYLEGLSKPKTKPSRFYSPEIEFALLNHTEPAIEFEPYLQSAEERNSQSHEKEV